MQAHITDFSLHISRLLAPSSSGIVHSVYHRTINLMFHGRLAALQSRGSVLSPVSLLADQEDLLAATGELITPGIPVQITDVSLPITPASSHAASCAHRASDPAGNPYRYGR